MPVGTGSINRAARTSKKAVEESKSLEKATHIAVNAEEAVEATTAKTAVSPSVSKTKSPAKKAAPKKTPAASVKTEEKAPELRVYGNETVFVVGNESCQLTQELPIHLL